MADMKQKDTSLAVLDAKSAAPSEIIPVESITAGEVQVDEEAHRRLRWRIDAVLMPLLCITYALQSIDKTTLNYAAVFGLKDTLNLSGNEYSWTGGIFYLGYLIWEYPTNVFLQKFPINNFLSGTVIAWGVVLMLHATVQNFSSLAAARTFLGAMECSIQPATMMIFSCYYTRSEQPLRMGIWIGCAGLGYVVAGIASFGIGHIHSSIESWRWTFLIWGAITTAWGALLLLLLPGSPAQPSRMFSKHQRELIVDRIKNNGTGLEEKKFKAYQLKEAMLDVKTWLLFFFAVASNAPNGGLTTFQGLIIKGLGFSTMQTTLIQMPSGAVQFVFCTIACFLATKFQNARLTIMLVCLGPFLAGVVGQWVLPQRSHYGRLACIWISFTYTATWTLSMSVVTANTAGRTKRGAVAAMLIIGYSLGNFVGPFFFKTAQAPRYDLGMGMMLFCIGVQVVTIIGLILLLVMRNRRKRTATTEKRSRSPKATAFLI